MTHSQRTLASFAVQQQQLIYWLCWWFSCYLNSPQRYKAVYFHQMIEREYVIINVQRTNEAPATNRFGVDYWAK